MMMPDWGYTTCPMVGLHDGNPTTLPRPSFPSALLCLFHFLAALPIAQLSTVTMESEFSRASSNELTSSASHSSTESTSTDGHSSEAPIDPASHNFNPLLPVIVKDQGCERCNLMVSVVYWYQSKNLDGDYAGDQSYVLHRTRGDLEDGVRNRCWWCLRLKTSLAIFEEPRNHAQVIKGAGSSRSVFLVFKLSTMFQSWFYVCISRTPRGNPSHMFRFIMKSCIYWQADTLLEGLRQIGSDTGGPATWRYVKDRLDNCERNHPECRDRKPWVPTRLVEVRMTGSVIQLRVVATAKWAEKKRYISLSHRWSSNLTLKLTKETHNMYQNRIPMEDLPRKYIDAIQAAQELRVQYLWIDSLCIIQDDQEDWETESAKMHLVYQHGYCNISAASSILADEGLFYERDATWVRPHVITPGSKMDTAVVREGMDREWYSRLDEEPLYKRAWVCQERLLSTRNVSFTRHLVYFECAKEMSSELSDAGGGGHAKNIRNRNRACASDMQLFSLRTLNEHQNPHQAWTTVVEFYSGCDLTHPTDKLVAVSGVARLFHERIKSDYLAGIWSDTLLESLAWQRSEEAGSPRPRYTQYLAPSWSWVSVNVKVYYSYFGNVFQPLAECGEVNTVPFGTDPFGRVQSGSLRLRCYPIPLLLDYDELRACETCPGSEFTIHMQSSLGTFFVPKGYRSGLVYCTLDAACGLDDYKVHQFAEGAEYYAVPLLTQFESGKGTDGTFFLVLEPLTPTWGLYRRVGMCFLFIESEGSDDSDDDSNSDGGGTMPVICQEGLSLGVPLEHCLKLARMIRASQEADVPAKERTDDGRCLITII